MVRVPDFTTAVDLVTARIGNGVACFTRRHVAREFARRIQVGMVASTCRSGAMPGMVRRLEKRLSRHARYAKKRAFYTKQKRDARFRQHRPRPEFASRRQVARHLVAQSSWTRVSCAPRHAAVGDRLPARGSHRCPRGTTRCAAHRARSSAQGLDRSRMLTR